MKYEVNDQFTVRDLQKAFSEQFPFLKIEFFSKAHKNEEASPVRKQYRHDRIQTIGTDHLTLDAQNDIGQQAQVVIHPDYNERIDNIEPW
jgi:hypothetical protein